MSKWLRLSLTILIVLIAASVVASPPNVIYRDIRAIGRGGTGITTMTDFAALMYNPAQLVRAEFHVDAMSVQASASTDVYDLLDFYNQHHEVLDNWNSDEVDDDERDVLMEGLTEFDENWIGFGAAPLVGVSAPGWAIGGYAYSDVTFKADKGIIEPRVYMRGVADYVLTAGVATQIPATWLPRKLYGGVSAKLVQRHHVEDMRIYASSVAVKESYDTLLDISSTGLGVDAGLLCELVPNRIDLGLKVTDLIGRIDGEMINPQVGVGASWHPVSPLVLAADHNDLFFNEGGNFFNNLHFGAEYAPNPFFALRGGVSQGYPTAGIGIGFSVLTIDGAVYGVEMTDRPGGESDLAYAVRLRLGI